MNSAFEGSHPSPDDHPASIIQEHINRMLGHAVDSAVFYGTKLPSDDRKEAKRRLFGALYGTKDADWAELVRGGRVFKSMLAEWPDMDDGDTIVRGSE